MLQIENALSIDKQKINITRPWPKQATLDANGLMLFPGLIDPHVHFRTPGLEHKEDWLSGAKAAIHGGYTTVFDMPNTLPPTVTQQLLKDKIELISKQLRQAGIPLRYHLYFGADKHHLSQIHLIKHDVVGIKVFMGCSTGNLVIDDDESLHAVFAIAATQNLLVAVHAEDEALIKAHHAAFKGTKNYPDHSRIRNAEVACRAVEKAIALAKIYNVRLYILHASTADEIQLIQQAKQAGLQVYAETTPHHLFLNDGAYTHLHGKAVVNPPLRSINDNTALWQAVASGVIDTIGSDHAPHTLDEKSKPYGECPSGMPGIETTLPLLITAALRGELSLQRIVELTCTKAREIFHLTENDDFVLVNMQEQREVQPSRLHTKCAWSAFAGAKLYGWPTHVWVNGEFITLNKSLVGA